MRERRETNCPYLSQPERQCLCGRGYRYAWAWTLVLPARTLVDLCSHCARALRYGSEDERRDIAEMLASANNDWRLAA
jgi:hypothetical protein